jgi:hypothetical protein
MLTWGRAVVAAREHGLSILAPSWVQPRLGGILRRERVNRLYLREFNSTGYVNGLCRLAILVAFRKESEERVVACLHSSSRAVIVFEGLRNYFRDIWHDHALIHEELLKIASPVILEKLQAVTEPFIAMHIRRGDIATPGFSEEQLLADKRYTPSSWYAAAAKAIQADSRWKGLPIFVVSDGRESELIEVLSLPNCRFVTQGTAIGDILLLSRARLLLASAHSTFSMWGSYLGRIPTIYFPGKMDQNVFPPGSEIFEGEWAHGQQLPRPNPEKLKF